MINRLIILKNKKIDYNKISNIVITNKFDKIFLLDIYGNYNKSKFIHKNLQVISTDSFYNEIINNTPNEIIKIFNKINLPDIKFSESKITEMNFADDFWINFVQYKIIKNIINFYHISTLNIISDNYFTKLKILKAFDKLNIFDNILYILIKHLYKYKYKFSFLKIYLSNFLKELIVFFLFKKKKNFKSSNIINTYITNWIIDNDTSYYRLTGNLKEEIFNDNNLNYMTSILRSNKITHSKYKLISNFYKNFKYDDRILIIENYLKLKDIFYSYLNIKLFNDRYFKKLNEHFNDYLTIDLYKSINSYYLVEIPKNLTFKRAYQNYFSINKKIKKVIIPIFELTNGRILTKIANNCNIKTYGMQQGSLGLFHKWRFFYNIYFQYLLDHKNIPKNILLEGKIAKEWFNEFNILNTEIIGAPRVVKKIVNFKKSHSNKYLIVLDMHNNDIYLNLIEELIKKYNDKLFIIRPHPSKLNILKSYFSKHETKNIKIDTNSDVNITLNLFNPSLILFSQSGYITEFMLSNWPCAVLKINGLPNYSPALIDKRLSNNIIFDTFSSNLNEFTSNINSVKNISKLTSKHHLNFIGNNSTEKLKLIINN